MSSSTFHGGAVPFVEHLGIRLLKMEAGESRVDFEPGPEHCQDSAIHEGVLLTILDVTLATSTRPEKSTGAITIEMAATFLRPAQGKVFGTGRLLHRDGKLAFAEGTIYDMEGRVCAKATGTFRNVPPSVKAGDSPAPVRAG